MFLDCVQLEPNIARNQALKENIFMMIVCIELRIPLFLVGKPGSSKSLARTIVADAMQGNRAHTELFRQFKEVLDHSNKQLADLLHCGFPISHQTYECHVITYS